MALINCKMYLIYHSPFFSEILRIITIDPEPQKLFSSSGCKRIKTLVTTELESNLI